MLKVKKLRHWKQADRGVVREMDAVCFPHDLTFSNNSNYHWWVVLKNEKPVAFAGLYVKDGVAHFERAGVMPACRGLGLQRRLIAARLRWCKTQGFSVVKTYTTNDNAPSIKNLEAFGFKGRCGRGKMSRFMRWTLRV